MTRWSKGYEALRWYVRFAFWLTHKRIVVTGRENLPIGKPIIFAANHQNALMDPLALSCTNPLQILWLARADIFKSKATQPILKFMKMIPIYRIRDGKDNLSNNEQVFSQVTQVLEDKGSVALFPEAAHSGRRQMLPHKKAIPRIALEAESKNSFHLGLQIVPVGIYYDHYWKFNRTLIVNYGTPIEVDSYKTRYTENEQNAMLVLRDEIQVNLSPLTMQINSEKYYHDCENIREVAGKEYAKLKFFSTDPVLQLFKAEQELMTKINQMETAQPQLFDKIRLSTNQYLQEIAKTGVSHDSIEKALKPSVPLLLAQVIVALLSMPLFAFGFLSNVIPYLLPRLILTGKVKDKAFLSSFHFAFGLILFPIFYLLEGVIIGLFTGSVLIPMAFMFFMPFAGKIAFNLLEFYRDMVHTFYLKLAQRKRLSRWSSLRNELLTVIRSAIF